MEASICASFDRLRPDDELGARPSPAPYTNLRSMSTRDAAAAAAAVDADDDGAAASGGAVVLVGSSRRRYVISAEHLSHPLIAALIGDEGRRREGEPAAAVVVNCEVVLFDHLLWMLDNADNDDLRTDDGAAMRELAQLYAC
ncbi:auxin-responsive protein SAUR76-like [Panicum virgatum]|nr:auxin-responsive protein SAUR76-like [Panicum virgatum]